MDGLSGSGGDLGSGPLRLLPVQPNLSVHSSSGPRRSGRAGLCFLSCARRRPRTRTASFRRLSANLPEGIVGEVDAARFALALHPRGDVYAVSKDVAVVQDDVTDVDADAKGDRRRELPGAFGHLLLNCHCRRDGIDGAGELDQHAIPVVLTIRPPCRAMAGSTISRRHSLKAGSVPTSSAPSDGYSRPRRPPKPPPISARRAPRSIGASRR